jgi:pimeloyl-ACP methyl ester carboxylesterase
VVEDMIRISDKLGQDKLNFWGFSYGTILGQYFVAMHPNKIGRVALDGNYYAAEYMDGQNPSDLVDTPDVAKSFFDFCYRGGPEKCPLYVSSPKAVEARVEKIFQSLRDEPIPVPFARSGPGLITDSILREMYFEAMYRPLAGFHSLATAMLAVEMNNQTRLAELLE